MAVIIQGIIMFNADEPMCGNGVALELMQPENDVF
jgi:hypothetical protein